MTVVLPSTAWRTASIWAPMSVGRDKAASRAYGSLLPVWTALRRVETKLRVFKAIVEPVLPV